MKPGLYLFILLSGVVFLSTACSRNFFVPVSPTALFTATPTRTNTPTTTPSSSPTLTASKTETNSPTSTPTITFTPTLTPTNTPTFTTTNSPTFTPTFTTTDSPTDTPTDTPSATPTNTIVCYPTPSGASSYTELEPPTQGGATGTNDSCATAENIGIVFAGTPLVISGSLNPAGTGAFNGDYDFYYFTAGSAGTYTLTVDCFSNGADNNLLDIVIFNTSCGYQYDPGATQPVVTVSATLSPGNSFYFMITAYNGTAPIPYHFTISSP